MTAESTAPRPFHLLGWLTVSAYALLVFWLSMPVYVGFYDRSIGVAFAFSCLHGLTIPLAVRSPRVALVVVLAGLLVIAFVTRNELDSSSFWPVSIPGLLSLVGIFVIVGLRESWVVAVASWFVMFSTIVLAIALWAGTAREDEEWGFASLAVVTASLIALVVATAISQRRKVRAVLAEAKRDVELEQAKRHSVEERARIARELHDVVAHSMSIVHIQAESAKYRVNDAAEAQREFGEIARGARAALREMRQLLGALRPEDGVEYAPQPSIADISALIQTSERVGNSIAYSTGVEAGAESAIVELTVYRVVQEALSNIARHAPNADGAVAISRSGHGITVRVSNGPPPRASRTGVAPDSGGYGLRGMRERVELLGGDVLQQPLPHGGFLIEASIPLTDRPGNP